MTKKRRDELATQVGLWQHDNHIDAVWFAHDEKLGEKQPHFFRLTRADFSRLPQLIYQQGNERDAKKVRYQFISAILPHFIWNKTLLLPQVLNTQECEKQCHFTLERELPIPLAEVWHDYCSRRLTQGFRLDIFAIKKTQAKEHANRFLPLKLDILDNAYKALLRGAHYVLNKRIEPQSLLIYQDKENAIAIWENYQFTYVLSQKNFEKLTALYDQFCQRYNVEPKRVYYYSTVPQADIPPDWHKIHTDLPLMALGNALWAVPFMPKNEAENDRTFEVKNGTR